MPPKQSSKQKAALGTPKLVISRHRLVSTPYEGLLGFKILVPGSWWPSATPTQKANSYQLQLFRIVPNWQPPDQKARKEEGFELCLINLSDPLFTAPDDSSVQDSNTWTVGRIEFSKLYYAQVTKNEKEEAAAEEIAAASAEGGGGSEAGSTAASPASPASPTGAARTSRVWDFFEETGETYRTKGGTAGSNFFFLNIRLELSTWVIPRRISLGVSLGGYTSSVPRRPSFPRGLYL